MQMYMTTVGLLGLSIFFDPFDANQSWREKPYWQKTAFLAQVLLDLDYLFRLCTTYGIIGSC
jgi:hypothetical protein